MQATEYEPKSEDLGNCPNCGEVVVREAIVRNGSFIYFWPCDACGHNHCGPECPALE